MIRSNIIAGFILLVVFALNGITILRVNQRYTNYLNQTLLSQSQLCGDQMETTLLQFSSDINQELSMYNSEIFSDPVKFQQATRSLRLFYTKYRELITKISIYDDKKNFYALYLETENNFRKEDKFVVDSFATRRQEQLFPRVEIEQNGTILEYFYPYFGQDMVTGNMVVQLDLQQFTESNFKRYPQVSDRNWQWVLSENGQIIIDNFKTDSVVIEGLQILTDSVSSESSGLLEHTIWLGGSGRQKVYTAYYPLSIYSRKMGIMFSVGRGDIYKIYITNNLIVSIMSQLLITFMAIYLLVLLGKQKKQEKGLKLSEIVLRQILEHFPMGILIIDEKNIIRNINGAAQRMLFLGKSGDLVGKDFSKQFLVSNKYLLSDGPSPFMDDSHYLYYEKDGMETVIYRSEKAANIGGEQLKLIALIDVSALEKSRKGEVAANKAKSDFLAAMRQQGKI